MARKSFKNIVNFGGSDRFSIFFKKIFNFGFSTKPGPSVERVALAGEAIAWPSRVRPLETIVVVIVVVVVFCCCCSCCCCLSQALRTTTLRQRPPCWQGEEKQGSHLHNVLELQN